MAELQVVLAWGLAITSFAGIVFLMVTWRPARVDERLSKLTGGGSPGVGWERHSPNRSLPPASAAGYGSPGRSIDRATARRLEKDEKKKDTKKRLVEAGLYRPGAVYLFNALRVVLLLGPLVAGVILAQLGRFPMGHGLLFGLFVGAGGTIAPTFWLDYLRRSRQTAIRRALPDALDVMVICLQGGLSLTGAIARVANELATAHPMLAVELKIVERQIQLGRSAGEALRELARRFDLEELRSLASVVVQAERVGSSIASALDVFAQTLRERRFQMAEERAQKAVIKIIFPMAFCIFPALMIVLVGPAAIIIYERLIKGVLSGNSPL